MGRVSQTGRGGLAVLGVVLAAGVAFAAGVGGRIEVDGSSTVYPISYAVADDFGKSNPDLDARINVSGTGGGFKRFTIGETDISDASRPIKQAELDKCQASGIDFIELPVAFDGLCVVVNKQNTWVDYLTTAELKKIWDSGSKLKSWKEVRPAFPDVPLKLFAPTKDNGTFDYFTEAINGEAQRSRMDYTSSVTPELLAQHVSDNKGALGYFGMAYYVENKDKLKIVPIGPDKVVPSDATVRNGTYTPLSRPLFIYVNAKSASSKPQVAAFVDYYLAHAKAVSARVGYVPLPDTAYAKVQAHWQARKTGSYFQNVKPGQTIEQVMSQEK
jgi:phosphate transport system substrate-binding protein